MSTTTTIQRVPVGTYTVDPVHSSFGFAVKHNGISLFRGQFEQVDARLEDGALTGTVQVESVKTAIADLKGHPILLGDASVGAFWVWLKAKYGYTEEQTRPYTFNLQPFFADKNTVQQGYPTSEPFVAQQAGFPVKFFLFAEDGYPPYGTTMVSTKAFVDRNPDVVARFVRASLEGWRSYLQNPAPANALIQADNPKMSTEQITFGVEQLRKIKVLDGGDGAKLGIGIMTEARWKATYDLAVAGGLIKPTVDWRAGFTDRFVKDLKLTM